MWWGAMGRNVVCAMGVEARASSPVDVWGVSIGMGYTQGSTLPTLYLLYKLPHGTVVFPPEDIPRVGSMGSILRWIGVVLVRRSLDPTVAVLDICTVG